MEADFQSVGIFMRLGYNRAAPSDLLLVSRTSAWVCCVATVFMPRRRRRVGAAPFELDYQVNLRAIWMTRQLSPFWFVVEELAVERVTQHAWPKSVEVIAGDPTLASRGFRKLG